MLNKYKRIEIKGIVTITTTREDREQLKQDLLKRIRIALNEANIAYDPGTVIDFQLKSISELPF